MNTISNLYLPLLRNETDENKVLSNWQLIRDVFNWGIWKVFGQVAEPYNDNNTDMEVVSENDIYGTFVFLYAIIFVVISNVLLLNVLIAMFNETIGDVIKKSNMIWRYQRFFLVHEFSEKPILPSPLSIIYYLLSTEKTLQRLENKVNGDNDHQLQHFQDVKVQYNFFLFIRSYHRKYEHVSRYVGSNTHKPYTKIFKSKTHFFPRNIKHKIMVVISNFSNILKI
ncbi:unnamed protein product [Rotaria magnacalcarata]